MRIILCRALFKSDDDVSYKYSSCLRCYYYDADREPSIVYHPSPFAPPALYITQQCGLYIISCIITVYYYALYIFMIAILYYHHNNNVVGRRNSAVGTHITCAMEKTKHTRYPCEDAARATKPLKSPPARHRGPFFFCSFYLITTRDGTRTVIVSTPTGDNIIL